MFTPHKIEGIDDRNWSRHILKRSVTFFQTISLGYSVSSGSFFQGCNLLFQQDFWTKLKVVESLGTGHQTVYPQKKSRIWNLGLGLGSNPWICWVGDVLRIRSHGIHHHLAPTFWEYVFIFSNHLKFAGSHKLTLPKKVSIAELPGRWILFGEMNHHCYLCRDLDVRNVLWDLLKLLWVLSNIFECSSLEKIPILTIFFKLGWNHHLFTHFPTMEVENFCVSCLIWIGFGYPLWTHRPRVEPPCGACLQWIEGGEEKDNVTCLVGWLVIIGIYRLYLGCADRDEQMSRHSWPFSLS